MIECFFGIMLCVGMLMLAEILVVCWVINKLKEFGEKIESLITNICQNDSKGTKTGKSSFYCQFVEIFNILPEK